MGETRASERRRLYPIVLSAALVVFMVRLDTYIVNISLPTISRYFHVGTSEVSWVVLSYLLVMTASMLAFGKLADRLGPKRIFLTGCIIFTVGSLFCGLSPTILLLYLARAVQGIGGAMMIVTAFTIISQFLPKDHTGWAFGICAFANSLGIMAGAPLGGLITGFLSWHWVFLLKIPIGIAIVLFARKALPGDKPDLEAGRKMPFDAIGSTLNFIFLTTLVYGFSMGQKLGWGSTIILGSFAVSGLSLMAFYFRERDYADPILDFRLLKKRDFSLAVSTTLLALMLLAGGNFLVPFHLEITKGLAPEMVGAILMVYSIIYMPIGLFSGRLSDRINPRRICTAAMLLTVVACFTFAFTLSRPGLWPVFLFLVLLAVSYGLFFAANNKLVMDLAPEPFRGVVSGFYSTVMNVGMIMGVCLFESAFSQALPPPIAGRHLLPDLFPAYAGPILEAFRIAFITGGFVCVAAFLLSLLTLWNRSTEFPEKNEP